MIFFTSITKDLFIDYGEYKIVIFLDNNIYYMKN